MARQRTRSPPPPSLLLVFYSLASLFLEFWVLKELISLSYVPIGVKESDSVLAGSAAAQVNGETDDSHDTRSYRGNSSIKQHL